ncbi:kinase-like protein [Macrolepiota fuliginosa MF-IS2]|uniref:Kinase-like protein n=1 Tax=Macrolepiota fuliginosa MF-IS2 TaxID=1400762 RepID=A0A9P5X241_9AGAR|nr:kinase-like protein [Macrolepiota fuliginosa MF-IS2]
MYSAPFIGSEYEQLLLLVIRDEKKCQYILKSSCTSDVQILLDLLQYLLTFPQISGTSRRELLAALLRLSMARRLYPQSFLIFYSPRANEAPVAYGSFGDIFKGTVLGQEVCLKKVRNPNDSSILKSFMREVIILGQLHHPNVLPFYGVDRWGESPGGICLVSPWMEGGNLCDYLHSHASADRLLLIRDVASGLTYVHDMCIVHGDLKGINVLVSRFGRACLADFGLASVGGSEIARPPSLETTGHRGATWRFEAPELLFRPGNSKIHRTTESDMYAFGCVCYQIVTGKVPFYELDAQYAVFREIDKGGMPTKPTEDALGTCQARGLTQHIWPFITSCWRKDPGKRPTAREILSAALLKDLQDLRPNEPSIPLPLASQHALNSPNDSASLLTAARGIIEKLPNPA